MLLRFAGRLTLIPDCSLEMLSWRSIPADERGRVLITPRGTRRGEVDSVETLEGIGPIAAGLVAKGKNIAVEAFLSRPADLEELFIARLTPWSARRTFWLVFVVEELTVLWVACC